MFVSVLLLTVNLSVPTVTSELVMLSLDLVKTRLSVMSMEMRKNFIQVILTSLIEKSPDPKILRAVVKIVEEWVKNNSPMAANQVRKRLFLSVLSNIKLYKHNVCKQREMIQQIVPLFL